jgi:DNA-binding NarL/FixJ family response regulator
MLNHRHFAVLGEGANLFEARYAKDPSALPDAVIYNLSRSEGIGDALAQLRQAQEEHPAVKAILIADPSSEDNILQIINSGVNAILSPDISAKLLLNSLELVMLGQHLFPTLPANFRTIREAGAVHRPTDPIVTTGPILKPSALQTMIAKQAVEVVEVITMSRCEPAVLKMSPITPGVLTPISQSNGSTDGAGALALSDREVEVLRCLIDGSPNKVIARALGIAETTVKVHVKGLLRTVRATNRTQAAVWAMNHYFLNEQI